MQRRDFITLLGAAAWPIALRAQQAIPVIGFLGSRSAGGDPDLFAAWHRGLKEAGYVEGQNLVIEYRFAENQYDRLPALAADLVRRRVSVIFANGPSALVAKASTQTITVVFAIADDPVALGLVASLNRPGGNLTGMTSLGVELTSKGLELLHEIVPATTVVAVIVNPTDPARAEATSRSVEAAAHTLGITVHVLHASTDSDFDPVFTSLARLRVGALVISPDPYFNSRIEQLAAITVRNAVPAIYQNRAFTQAGGLMSYGASLTDMFRQAGVYTGRILMGEKPAEMPIAQPTKFEFVLNLKTAKALGLEVPLKLHSFADEVIQ
jgi:putative ABC transport system substrate-binding protein